MIKHKAGAETGQTHLLMSPGLIGEGLGSTPFFFPSSLFPEPEKAYTGKQEGKYMYALC